jgi:hypothetical protein
MSLHIIDLYRTFTAAKKRFAAARETNLFTTKHLPRHPSFKTACGRKGVKPLEPA